MEKLNIDPELIVEIEYTDIEANKLFNLFKPFVFEDDGLYCCLWGPDLRFGIKGFGHTPLESVEDWEISLRKRIASPFANDAVAQYIMNTLNGGSQYAAAG